MLDYDGHGYALMTNILIIKLSAIGDVVQALPALEAIKRTFPASSITWVVEEAAAGILEGHLRLDTRDPDDPELARDVNGVLDYRGLTDARRAGDLHQAAPPRPGSTRRGSGS